MGPPGAMDGHRFLRSFLPHEPPSIEEVEQARDPSGEQPRVTPWAQDQATMRGYRPITAAEGRPGRGRRHCRRVHAGLQFRHVTLCVLILTKNGNSAGVHTEISAGDWPICDPDPTPTRTGGRYHHRRTRPVARAGAHPPLRMRWAPGKRIGNRGFDLQSGGGGHAGWASRPVNRRQKGRRRNPGAGNRTTASRSRAWPRRTSSPGSTAGRTRARRRPRRPSGSFPACCAHRPPGCRPCRSPAR